MILQHCCFSSLFQMKPDAYDELVYEYYGGGQYSFSICYSVFERVSRMICEEPTL